MQKQRFPQKIIKFLIGGGITTCFNLILIFMMIDWWGWNTILLHNIANVVSIELSILLSFFIYRVWVWTEGEWTIKEMVLKQIPMFHLAAGTVVIARIFFLFPLLDYWSVNPEINTLAGGVFGAAINYFTNEKLVFNHHNQSGETSINLSLD